MNQMSESKNTSILDSGFLHFSYNNLTDDQIKTLYYSKTPQAKFFLEFKVISNQCITPFYERDIKHVHGGMKMIKLKEKSDGCYKEYDYLIIPTSPQVIMMAYEEYEFMRITDLYLFDAIKGWTRIGL